ncbi:hypothetical protein LSTR_LSTR011285 [Laodelphax striatellus]|uniref:Pre-rRNA-processing protein TSR1 homolog n=1 Tax=Laodelphax striatellus TaxID=195883 RepID=A0A482X5G9_LAOST|nr:hypothetical protein LSTR_LSTR011285 [Laodelphax striatellus]
MGIDNQQERHRPGQFKQQNKLHKHGRHRSKGSIDNLNKGRVSVKFLTKRANKVVKKEERKNQLAQIRNKKRAEYLEKRRGISDAPHMVAVVTLSQGIQYDKIFEQLEKADDDASVTYTTENHVHINLPRFRQRFTFVRVERDELFNVLDVLKAADTVLFVVSVLGIDDWGDLILTAALAQGLPTCAVVLVGLELVLPKKRQESKSQIQKAVNSWLPDEKISVLEKPGDALNLFRRIGNQKQRSVQHRDRHPYVLAEAVQFVPDEQSGRGTLIVTGFLKGKPLSVNSLVHIAGWGDYQMKRIESPAEPNPMGGAGGEAGDVRVLAEPDADKQEQLISENIPDPMDAEQTWPTEEELAAADEERKNKKKVKRVPKGMSEYQAAWIPDSDAEEEEDSDEEDEDEVMMDAREDECSEDEAKEESDDEEEEEYESTTSELPPPADKYDKEMNYDEEKETLKKIKDARLDQMFPDEVDTPADVAARDRYQKYRGLQSFRTSPWDAKEDLPGDYARIFQFQNFNRTRKRVMDQLDECSGAYPGWYISVHVANVPETVYRSRGAQPVVLFGMLAHEQKMSVVNMVLKRPNLVLDASAHQPIRSKQRLVFQCGYRRYSACPLFSQHTNGTKHKYERYFQPDATVVATVFAPIMFPPCSVLAFEEKSDGSMPLVATGSLLSVNPDRLVIKRVVLSGHPFKVNKRSAVIRYMFFNREDIAWFKPVELRTKYGRRGHIKEPLGTHGHMKCVFDGQLKSQDTVLLNLYKRVFPKWTYEPVVCSNTVTPME